MQEVIESFCGERGLPRWEELVQKFIGMDNFLLGLDLRELVPTFREHKVGLKEFLLMKEEDMV